MKWIKQNSLLLKRQLDLAFAGRYVEAGRIKKRRERLLRQAIKDRVA